MRIRLVIGVLALCAVPLTADSHVAPSVDENNRYLRLTAMGDRVRLAYTLYVGEVPGAQARRRLDTNRNGLVDEVEADAYGRELAQVVARGLTIEVDGVAHAMHWAEVHVGLGTPATNAGSFSVDLIGWLCVPDPAEPSHRVVLRDAFRVPRPGEHEIMLEESPGVTITRSVLGADGARSRLKMLWRGDRGYLRDGGLYLDFSVDPALAVIQSPEECARAAMGTPATATGAGKRSRKGAAIALGAAALVVLAGFFLVRRYRKTKG